MRTCLILCLVSVVGLGCAQMRYSGRYQEVRVESEPPGAAVIIEGEISDESPLAIQTEEGTALAYHSPVRLTTPVVLILDKETPEYKLKVHLEGYPEYSKTLCTRFAFHPYLVVLFPIVPLWTDYEVRRFDDIFVDFDNYVTELRAEQLSGTGREIEELEAAYVEKVGREKVLRVQLDENRQELKSIKKEVQALKKELKKAEKAQREELSNSLADAQIIYEGQRDVMLDIYREWKKTIKEKEEAKKKIKILRKLHSRLQEDEKARQLEVAVRKLKEAQTLHEQAYATVNQAEAELKANQDKLADAETLVAEYKKRLSEALEKLDAAEEGEEEAAQAVVDDAQAQLDPAQVACDQQQQVVEELQERFASAKEAEAEAKQKLDAANKRYAQLTKTKEEEPEEE